MGRVIESQFEFEARYEVEQLERIDKLGGASLIGFPDPVNVNRQQELADRPILRVHPLGGDPWVGVFYGRESYPVPPACHGRLLAWPDERSTCVVYAGSGTVVRSDAPDETYDIASFPITDLLVIPSHSMVVFADFTNLAAYGADGIIWRSPRLALDELAITGAEGDVLHATGFFGDRSDIPISVDLQTGLPREPLPLDLSD
jgi:hypothetical protein